MDGRATNRKCWIPDVSVLVLQSTSMKVCRDADVLVSGQSRHNELSGETVRGLKELNEDRRGFELSADQHSVMQEGEKEEGGASRAAEPFCFQSLVSEYQSSFLCCASLKNTHTPEHSSLLVG
ncbi:hypothetical protein G5714_022392 [Onychostoma macrolepis]|uniref:Uncharacterized protein n=1 Tax=Onychostoma macrolepis TaxID=369639 RepID=A0A7J6BPS9_9TELE|nr:hypothetical protein G5714_022392 [Onychostoma macrolepis]